MLSREAENANFIVFGLTLPELEFMIFALQASTLTKEPLIHYRFYLKNLLVKHTIGNKIIKYFGDLIKMTVIDIQ